MFWSQPTAPISSRCTSWLQRQATRPLKAQAVRRSFRALRSLSNVRPFCRGVLRFPRLSNLLHKAANVVAILHVGDIDEGVWTKNETYKTKLACELWLPFQSINEESTHMVVQQVLKVGIEFSLSHQRCLAFFGNLERLTVLGSDRRSN